VDEQPTPRKGFQPVPVRYLLPNLITLLALCSGITAIRLAFEGRFEIAVAAIILAIVLDALDGRLARLLKGTSKFGAELDSLADSVNFGVAPALVIYFWSLNAMKPVGWIICLALAIACALRLARFNVALEDPLKPAYANAFFTGMPAPAGAGLSLMPLYYGFWQGEANGHAYALWIAPFILAIAIMMVSRIPTFSGKTVTRVPRDIALPLLAAAVLSIVCLLTYPWETLLVVGVLYVAMIPISVAQYLRYKRQAAAHTTLDP
jgi:CDP-diacylglycerol---serine O-phosphatidyltransferase